MAEIITSIQPGRYTTGQTLTVTFPADTRKAIVTRTDRAPILSEILAYDVGTIPPGTAQVERPFIAVTQDGRGNVVYDGGFPKFYNRRLQVNNAWPTVLPTTFAELTPSSKYMYNALNFCSDKRKVANGNRKVLLFGDTYQSEGYNVQGSHYNPLPGQEAFNELNGFKDTFTVIANVGGWDLTVKDMTGVVGMLDIPYAELDQYAVVIYISSMIQNAPSTRISDALVNNLATLRSSGTGLIVITDDNRDGGNYTSVEDAAARGSGFLVGANKVVAPYGCYFSGNVERQPVLVSEIKRQLGYPGPPESHPLLAGLADTDSIAAGTSESLVYPELYLNDQVDPAQPLVIPLTTAGNYRVNVLVQLEDGTILTRPMLFNIIDPSALSVNDSFNRIVTGSSQTYKPAIAYTVHNNADPTLTMFGEIYLNNILQGYFGVMSGVTTYKAFAGPNAPMPAKNGDVINFLVKQPFEFGLSVTLNIPDAKPYYDASGTIAGFIGKIKTHPYFSGITDTNVILSDIVQFTDKQYTMAALLGPSVTQYYWKTIGKCRLPFRDVRFPINAELGVYTNPADWTTNKPAFGNDGQAVIIASTNAVYYWNNTSQAWELHPQPANTLFGLGRHVLDTRTSTRWVIQVFTTVKL